MLRKTTVSLIAITALCALLAQTASATPVLSFGATDLLPDTPNQMVQVFVSGGDAVTGVNFNFQVNDGGVDVGGSDPIIPIVSVDLVTGTIFASNHIAQYGDTFIGGIGISIIETNSGTVAADGLLATVILDTTGIYGGSFNLTTNTLNGPISFTTTGPDTVPNNIAGTINVVPEPASMILIGLGAVAVLGRRRRAA